MIIDDQSIEYAKSTERCKNLKEFQRFKIINNQGFFAGNKVDPFFYSLQNIPFHLFLTFHYRHPSFYGNTCDALLRRNRLISDIIHQTRTQLNLPQKSIHYFGTSEKGISERIHTHTLVHLREDILTKEDSIITQIIDLLPSELIDTPKQAYGGYPPQVEKIENSQAVSSYLCKVRPGSDQIKWEHHSQKFTTFANCFKLTNSEINI